MWISRNTDEQLAVNPQHHRYIKHEGPVAGPLGLVLFEQSVGGAIHGNFDKFSAAACLYRTDTFLFLNHNNFFLDPQKRALIDTNFARYIFILRADE